MAGKHTVGICGCCSGVHMEGVSYGTGQCACGASECIIGYSGGSQGGRRQCGTASVQDYPAGDQTGSGYYGNIGCGLVV